MLTPWTTASRDVLARSAHHGNMRSCFRPRNRIFIAGFVWIFALLVLVDKYYFYDSYAYDPASGCRGVSTASSGHDDADDILVVLRTGATEALEKLPVHFDTTLRCVRHLVVYSDVEEEVAGHHVHDVFAAKDAISDELRASQDMAFYRHLTRLGRKGLLGIQAQAQAQASMATTTTSTTIKELDHNPAWKLDRFKFLPMVAQALEHRPTAKWFVFIEADTYLVWQNLVAYLSLFDPTKPFYIGKHMYMDDVLFAHGGSGFVLSQPAMRRVVEQRNAHGARYDAYTKESAAGDMVLGKMLADVHVPLFSAFPHFQGDPVTALHGNVTKIDRRPWCYAPITYHHMHEHEIRALWQFEQSRTTTQRRKSNAPLRHRDVFDHFIRPQLRSRVDDWDNFSLDTSTNSSSDTSAVQSFAQCEAICEADSACLQFSYETSTGRCAASTQVVLGEAATRQCVEYSSAAGRCVKWQGDEDNDDNDNNDDDDEETSRVETTTATAATPGSVQSGWMLHRMQRYVEEMDTMCGNGKMDMWIV